MPRFRGEIILRQPQKSEISCPVAGVRLILLAVIARAADGGLELERPDPVYAGHPDLDGLRLHDVAALPHRGDELRGAGPRPRREGPAVAEAPARVREHGELHAVGDADPASVAWKWKRKWKVEWELRNEVKSTSRREETTRIFKQKQVEMCRKLMEYMRNAPTPT